jgi:hypothetical protein
MKHHQTSARPGLQVLVAFLLAITLATPTAWADRPGVRSTSRNTNANQNQNRNVNVNQNANKNVNINQNVNKNVNVNQSVNKNVNVNVNRDVDVNVHNSACTGKCWWNFIGSDRGLTRPSERRCRL